MKNRLVRAYIKSDARIRRFVAEEICQRFIPVRCFRAMRNMYYGIFARIKYRGLISICGRIAAENDIFKGIFSDLCTLLIDSLAFFHDNWVNAVLEDAYFIRDSGFL